MFLGLLNINLPQEIALFVKDLYLLYDTNGLTKGKNMLKNMLEIEANKVELYLFLINNMYLLRYIADIAIETKKMNFITSKHGCFLIDCQNYVYEWILNKDNSIIRINWEVKNHTVKHLRIILDYPDNTRREFTIDNIFPHFFAYKESSEVLTTFAHSLLSDMTAKNIPNVILITCEERIKEINICDPVNKNFKIVLSLSQSLSPLGKKQQTSYIMYTFYVLQKNINKTLIRKYDRMLSYVLTKL